MRILFSRLLIYVRRETVRERPRVCGWGKNLHTLLVKSPIYVNLGTLRTRYKRYANKRIETMKIRLAATLFIYARSNR